MIKFNSSYLIIIIIIIIYLCYLTNISILEETFTNNLAQLCKDGNVPHSVGIDRGSDVSENNLNYVKCIQKFSDAYQGYATYNPKETNPCKFFNNINSDFKYTCNEYFDTSSNDYSGLLFAKNDFQTTFTSNNYFDPLLDTANKIISEFKSIDVSTNRINDAMDQYIDGNYTAKLKKWKGPDCSTNDGYLNQKPVTINGETMTCEDISKQVFRIYNQIYRPNHGWDAIENGYKKIGKSIEDLSYMKSDFYNNEGNKEQGLVSDGYVRNYIFGSGFIKGDGQQWRDTSNTNYFTRIDNADSKITQQNGDIFYKDMSNSISYAEFIDKINKTFGRNNNLNFKSKELHGILSSRMKLVTIIFTIIILLALVVSLYYYNVINLSLIKIICIILFIIIVIFVIHFYGNLDSIKIIINNLLQ